jgi:hypothetical protein
MAVCSKSTKIGDNESHLSHALNQTSSSGDVLSSAGSKAAGPQCLSIELMKLIDAGGSSTPKKVSPSRDQLLE